MAILNETEINKIAHLARLSISADKIPEYAKNLSEILDFVEQINSANTDKIEPMVHPLSTSQRFRTDEVTESNQRELFQTIAPQTEAGLYLVPKVIEE